MPSPSTPGRPGPHPTPSTRATPNFTLDCWPIPPLTSRAPRMSSCHLRLRLSSRNGRALTLPCSVVYRFGILPATTWPRRTSAMNMPFISGTSYPLPITMPRPPSRAQPRQPPPARRHRPCTLHQLVSAPMLLADLPTGTESALMATVAVNGGMYSNWLSYLVCVTINVHVDSVVPPPSTAPGLVVTAPTVFADGLFQALRRPLSLFPRPALSQAQFEARLFLALPSKAHPPARLLEVPLFRPRPAQSKALRLSQLQAPFTLPAPARPCRLLAQSTARLSCRRQVPRL